MSAPIVERDFQRGKVYQAEQFARTLFARAGQHPGRSMDFFGSTLTLPPEAKFSGVPEVQRYVERVLAMPAVRERWPDAGPVSVRAHRGAQSAFYRNGTIAVPGSRSGAWFFGGELPCLHELAHHLAPEGAAHGPQYVETFRALVAMVMGPEAGHVIHVLYAHHGVR
jgi:putative metallohydrolase (TIGR04338 family)